MLQRPPRQRFSSNGEVSTEVHLVRPTLERRFLRIATRGRTADHFRTVGLYCAPVRRLSSICCVRAEQALPLSGVKLSCSESISGNGSVGPRIWFRAVQIPAGGETVSMKPMPAITGALMREAKLTGSK